MRRRRRDGARRAIFAAATTVIAALVAPAFALGQSRPEPAAKPAVRHARSTPIARTARVDCAGARSACRDAALWTAYACRSDCGRLADGAAVDSCRAGCRTRRAAGIALCRAVAEPCAAACAANDVACSATTRACRAAARDAHLACRTSCAEDFRCRIACDRQRAAAGAACAFVAAEVEPGPGELPDLPSGRPANLAVLLDDTEFAVVADADARAATLRSRPLRLWIGRADTDVTVTQVRHAFSFGFPIDFRDYRDAPQDLAFYTGIAVDHTNLMVAETSMKWRLAEPEEGRFTFALADEELAWAESLGFPVKSHTLLWGNVPPLSSGTGVPVWVRETFANADPPAAEQELLRMFIRRQVETTVQRYRGRVQIWDVTNETLNLFTPFFIDRLGPGIVNDIFGWVNAIDPGAQLVFNEWITEVFTGLPGPSAANVRDRVRELLAAGVPIHAIGQQGHFVPGVVYAGGSADLSQRTRVDDYAQALDTLAEVGLPIHITETNFVAPDEPEARAAQAEAIMRVWWGHPAVEQIVFWGLWNKVNARNYLHHGLWDDDGTLTRHGEAVVALLNERWRTRAVLRSDTTGAVELRAILGDYVASWEENGTPRHVRFRLDRGMCVFGSTAAPARRPLPRSARRTERAARDPRLRAFGKTGSLSVPMPTRAESQPANRPARRVASRRGFVRAAVFAMAALFSTTIAAAESPAPVRVVRARAAGGGETLRLTGSVTAAQRAGLSPRVSGLVATVHVDAGDRVKKGQLLVELDRALAELALRRARAGAAEARVRLAEAERLRSEAAELVRDKYIPETDAHARAAQVNIDSAVVARLEAEEREAAELVERHAVVAPFAGVISRKFSEAGEWVETGTPVLELVDIEHLRLDVQAPQERFADIDASTRVTVRLDGHPENRFAGRVAAVVPVNDPGARTFLVRVLLDDTGGRMIPGMSAEAIFDLAGNPDAVAVPRDALVRAPDGTDRVWVVEETDGDTRAFPRTVRVGRALTSTVEVVGGLEGDLPVVVRGNENLREGQTVEVIED